MNQSTHPTWCCLVFCLAVLLTACQSEKKQSNASTSAPPALQQLLQAADTLSADALAAEVRKLPGTWMDTFFQERCFFLIGKHQGQALYATTERYEKIRPDNEEASAFIHFSRGVAQNYAGRLDSSEAHFKLAQDFYEKIGDKKTPVQRLRLPFGHQHPARQVR